MGLREVPADAAGEPLHVGRPRERDRPEDHRADPLGVGHRIREAEGRPPGAAEEEPPVDPEVVPQPLQVRHEMGRRVDRQVGGGVLRRRGAPAGAALVEQDDAVALRVEEPRPPGAAARARAAVEHHRRNAVRGAPDLVVEPLPVADVEEALVVGRGRLVHPADSRHTHQTHPPRSTGSQGPRLPVERQPRTLTGSRAVGRPESESERWTGPVIRVDDRARPECAPRRAGSLEGDGRARSLELLLGLVRGGLVDLLEDRPWERRRRGPWPP